MYEKCVVGGGAGRGEIWKMSRHLCDVAITGKGRAASRVALSLRCGECAITACVLTFRTSRLRGRLETVAEEFYLGRTSNRAPL